MLLHRPLGEGEDEEEHIMNQQEIEEFGLEGLIASGEIEPNRWRLTDDDVEHPAYLVALRRHSSMPTLTIHCRIRRRLAGEFS